MVCLGRVTFIACVVASATAFGPAVRRRGWRIAGSQWAETAPPNKAEKGSARSHDAEVVIIGSGLAGLCCGALLAHNGVAVTVVESHDELGWARETARHARLTFTSAARCARGRTGGACHSWERRGYSFESGPSLYSGFSADRSPNPLKGIFDIVGESPEWLTYDRWGTVLPEGRFAAKIGPEEFGDVLKKVLRRLLCRGGGGGAAAQAPAPGPGQAPAPSCL